ncbi:MAG: cobalamin biosynthesis protein [Eubacteriales bacterium]
MKIGILAFSERVFCSRRGLCNFFSSTSDEAVLARCKAKVLESWTAEHFSSDDALVFIGAAGIAVRAIAPHVKSKLTDPAVVVFGRARTYSVSLSGHLGGANELATRIARFFSAILVITTATDQNGVFSVDSWAKKQGLAIINPERIKWVSSRLLAGETVLLSSKFPVEGALPAGIVLTTDSSDILVTWRTRGKAEALKLVPPVITLGVGCRKDTSAEHFEAAFQLMLKKAGCHPAAVKQVCSIDLKAGEPGLVAFCRSHALPFHTFSAPALANAPGKFSGSAFVKSVTGVDNVCERSAVLGCGENGQLLTKKDAEYGITMALAIEPYTVRFAQEGNEQ